MKHSLSIGRLKRRQAETKSIFQSQHIYAYQIDLLGIRYFESSGLQFSCMLDVDTRPSTVKRTRTTNERRDSKTNPYLVAPKLGKNHRERACNRLS